ncbi:MAG: Eco57I restriction-modification methylase domain-containing protein, partial [Thermosphaera sp.]
KFDYVVGNPPWVRWEDLPDEYRKITKRLWEEEYHLVGAGAGGFKRDLAMLFLARCFDLYLKPGGRHGFLMPFTVFKTQAGAGFRRFLATKTRIIKIHDMVTLYPFEGAVNRTSAIVVEKICELRDIGSDRCQEVNSIMAKNKRVNHVIWVNKTGKAIPTDTPLEQVLKMTDRFDAIMVPLVDDDVTSPWMQVTEKMLQYVRRITQGSSLYKAHEGVNVALNQVYYVQIKDKTPDGRLVITNPPEPGQKKKVKQVEVVVEPDLVYPLIRGKDVEKWFVEYKGRYVILPHDPKTGKPLSEIDFKVKYKDTFSYLNHYRDELITRSIKPFLSQLKQLRELERKKLAGARNDEDRKKVQINLESVVKSIEKIKNELYSKFYIVDNIGSYTFAPYKVVWKEVSARMQAGGFHVAVVGLVEDEYLGSRVVVPDHTVVMISLQNEEEAYYLAGVLNSTLTQFALQYAVVSSVEEYISVPNFNPDDPVHRNVAKLSRRAHELARCLYSQVKPGYCSSIHNPKDELARVEDELDRAVAQLYGIPEDAIEGFRKLLNTFAGKEGG